MIVFVQGNKNYLYAVINIYVALATTRLKEATMVITKEVKEGKYTYIYSFLDNGVSWDSYIKNENGEYEQVDGGLVPYAKIHNSPSNTVKRTIVSVCESR